MDWQRLSKESEQVRRHLLEGMRALDDLDRILAAATAKPLEPADGERS